MQTSKLTTILENEHKKQDTPYGLFSPIWNNNEILAPIMTSVLIFGTLLMGCSDEEIANVETSSRNAIGFNVLSNAAETRATPITNTNLRTRPAGRS